MTTSLLEIKPLCWLRDKDDNTFYKECTYDSLKEARRGLLDIECFDLKGKRHTITHYEINKYGEADVIDHFLFFVLPKEDKIIRDRFHTMLGNMTKRDRVELTYERAEKWIAKQKSMEHYYSEAMKRSPIDRSKIDAMRAETKFKIYFSGFRESILKIIT